MKIYLMRHGQSVANERGVLCGWTDMPLTERGKEQAATARNKIRGVQFDAIVSSPLKRALETAGIVADGQDVTVVDDFRERNLGALEGMTWEEVERDYPDVPVAWPGDPVHFAPPEGESTQALYDRVSAAADALIGDHPDARNLMIVAHGAALACTIAHLLDQGPENAFRYKLNNCTLAVIHIIDGFGMLDRLE